MQKTLTNHLSLITLLAVLSVFIATIFVSQSAHAAQPTVNLRTASPFAILSGTPGITDAGNTSVINGNVGLYPASGAGIGLLCTQVSGTIYSADATGPLPCRITDSPLLLTAKNNLTTAYNDAAGRTPFTTLGKELGGKTLVAGVYVSTDTTFEITNIGPLVLDGQNDPSSVFIFQAPFEGTGLTVGPGSTVSLINGAQACNVFWRVDTASINTTGTFVGTVLALNSISVANGATIDGRLLARNGSVTLNNDTITASICAGNDTLDATPGLPNTGEASNQSTILAIATSTFLATAASLIAYAFYKKRSI
jgi:LPXTG-motif cell wall-anchored protein